MSDVDYVAQSEKAVADLEAVLKDVAPMLPPDAAKGLASLIVKLDAGIAMIEKFAPIVEKLGPALAAVEATKTNGGGVIEVIGSLAKALL